jgi:hypothetical protein
MDWGELLQRQPLQVVDYSGEIGVKDGNLIFTFCLEEIYVQI